MTIYPLKHNEKSASWLIKFSILHHKDIRGKLFYDYKEGIHIDVYDDALNNTRMDMVECVQGIVNTPTERGVKVTLLNCFIVPSKKSEYFYIRLIVNHILWGEHIDALNRNLIKKYTYSSPSLNRFMQKGSLNYKPNSDLSIDYNKPPARVYKHPKLGELIIESNIKGDVWGPKIDGSIEIQEDHYFSIITKNPKELLSAIIYTNALDTIFGMFSDCYAGPPRVVVFDQDPKGKKKNSIAFSGYLLKTNPGYRDTHLTPHFYNLVLFKEIDRTWGKVISTYLEKYEELQFPLNMYNLSNEVGMTIETRFANVCIALEGLHRRLFAKESTVDQKELSNAVETMRKLLKEHINSKEIRAIIHGGLLASRDEPSLLERYEEIVKLIPNGNDFFGEKDIRGMVEERNNMFHAKPVDYDDLDRVRTLSLYGDILKHLIELSLLVSLGCSALSLEKIMARNVKIRGHKERLDEAA